MSRLMSLFGLFTMIMIAWALSSNRRRVNWRVVLGGLALQFLFALLILKTAPGRWFFTATGDILQATINHVEAGSLFVFGINGRPGDEPMPPRLALLRSIAFGVLPTIVFFSSLMSILYYLGVMQWIVELLARLMQRTLGTSGAESLSAAANIFVGQTEAPLVVRPYVDTMTLSELNAVMVGGFATIAGGVLAAYVAMGIDPGHLITASVISAPAALLIAKLMVPETETPQTLGHVRMQVEEKSVNLIEAAAVGAGDGMKLAINVAAMLIAFLALLSLVNGVLGWLGTQWNSSLGPALSLTSDAPWTLESLFGILFSPIAWIMGVPWQDCRQAGELLGIKMVGNEFIAYDGLGRWQAAGSPESGPQPRTVLILTYALSGFANFGSIGIQIGGIGAIAPKRRSDLARLGLRAMIGGTLAAFMTACVAGVLTDDAAMERPTPTSTRPETMQRSTDPVHTAAHQAPSGGNRKPAGKSSVNEVSRVCPELASINQIFRSSQNSANTWRHAPQGTTPPAETMASDTNDLAPWHTADAMATRSAQTVSPNDAFSTLHPMWMAPVVS
jgi:CNT family concentrative nucleoside transporter